MRQTSMSKVVFGMLSLMPAIRPASAGGIWWKDHDGASGTLPDSWANLQTAIDNAQGGSGSGEGWVKIAADTIAWSAGNTQLSMSNTAGRVRISGGWTWIGDGVEPVVQGGRSVVDAANQCRVLSVYSVTNVTLENLAVTRGRPYYSEKGGGVLVQGVSHGLTMTNVWVCTNTTDLTGAGAGVAIVGTTDLAGIRLVECTFADNENLRNETTVNNAGVGLYLYLVGTASSPAVVERCSFLRNRSAGSMGAGLGVGCYDNVRLLVVHCRFVGNNAPVGTKGSAVWVGNSNRKDNRITLFGCLFTDNYGRDAGGNPAPGAAVIAVEHRNADPNSESCVLANCTVVSNRLGIVFDDYWPAGASEPAIGQGTMTRLVNTIVAGEQGFRLGGSATTGSRCHIDFQNSTFRLAATDAYAFKDPTGWTYTNTLWQALAAQDNFPTNRFHSLAANNARSQSAEQNLEADPGFIGAGADPYRLWWERRSSPAYASAIDRGIARTNATVGAYSGYAYVDVSLNGVYDALVDVIVGLNGQPHPGPGHFVHTTDLAGHPRFVHNAIDRGAYECDAPPAAGTIVMLK